MSRLLRSEMRGGPVRSSRCRPLAEILRGGLRLGLIGSVLLWVAGCATQGDFRKLEEHVLDVTSRVEAQADPFERIAALSAELDTLRDQQRKLAGELEVARKTADDALAEARKAREAQAAAATPGRGATTPTEAGPEQPEAVDATVSAEVLAYQEGLSAWRENNADLCIDRFRKFLQTYPSSAYADDAAYWMADCHFKKGNYRVAVLRFNDVVRVYPTGNKAADALYRQGESLLKLGPGFYDAARTVFKQVLNDYPDSARAHRAKQQLEAIGKAG